MDLNGLDNYMITHQKKNHPTSVCGLGWGIIWASDYQMEELLSAVMSRIEELDYAEEEYIAAVEHIKRTLEILESKRTGYECSIA